MSPLVAPQRWSDSVQDDLPPLHHYRVIGVGWVIFDEDGTLSPDVITGGAAVQMRCRAILPGSGQRPHLPGATRMEDVLPGRTPGSTPVGLIFVAGPEDAPPSVVAVDALSRIVGFSTVDGADLEAYDQAIYVALTPGLGDAVAATTGTLAIERMRDVPVSSWAGLGVSLND